MFHPGARAYPCLTWLRPPTGRKNCRLLGRSQSEAVLDISHTGIYPRHTVNGRKIVFGNVPRSSRKAHSQLYWHFVVR